MGYNSEFVLRMLPNFEDKKDYEAVYENYYSIINDGLAEFILININRPSLLKAAFNSLEMHLLYCIVYSYQASDSFYKEHFIRYIQELVFVSMLRRYFDVKDELVDSSIETVFFLDSEIFEPTINKIRTVIKTVNVKKENNASLNGENSIVVFDKKFYHTRLSVIEQLVLDFQSVAIHETTQEIDRLVKMMDQNSISVAWEILKYIFSNIRSPFKTITGVSKMLHQSFQHPEKIMKILRSRCNNLEQEIKASTSKLIGQIGQAKILEVERRSSEIRQDCVELLKDPDIDADDKEVLMMIFKQTNRLSIDANETKEKLRIPPEMGFIGDKTEKKSENDNDNKDSKAEEVEGSEIKLSQSKDAFFSQSKLTDNKASNTDDVKKKEILLG